MKKTQAEILRKILRDSGKTQTQISNESGVQQGSLSRFLKEQQDIFSGDGLIKILDYVGAKVIFPGESADGGPCPQCDFLRAKITELEIANKALHNVIKDAMQGNNPYQTALDAAPQVKALPEVKEHVS